MLKQRALLKYPEYEVENAARARILEVLSGIPFITCLTPESTSGHPDGSDFTVALDVAGSRWTLICSSKRLGQPRHIREAAFQLHRRLAFLPEGRAYGVFVAPYLSEESIAVLREESLGYLDFAGNCFLSFDTVFIERRGAPNPSIRRRSLRELFAPKAARVLRNLLADPDRSWRVTDLAKASSVSLGQVSNVRRALVDREWATVNPSGVRLKNPGALLDAWRFEYTAPILFENQYHTLLHGDSLDDALRSVFAAPAADQHLLLSSFSAARWIAPFARVAGHFFYSDSGGEALLKAALKLEPVPRGANVVLARPKDNGVFIDRRRFAVGLWSTGPVQTYLDLGVSGDRGKEAAAHLRREALEPAWNKLP